MNDGLFSGNSLLDIDVNYTIEKNKAGYPQVTVIDDKKAAVLKADEKTKDKVQTLRTKWRNMSWQTANELLTKATVYNFHTQQDSINWTLYRDSRLKSGLVEWNAQNNKGEVLPCTEQYINQLNASVALALLEKYDAATSADKEEEEKKS